MRGIEAHQRLRVKNLLLKGYDLFDWYWNRRMISQAEARLRSQRPENPKQILVLRFASLGDVIRSTAVVRDLRAAYPTAAIDILTSEQTKILFRGNPHIRHIFDSAPDGPYDWIINLQVADPPPTFLSRERYLALLEETASKTRAPFWTGPRVEGGTLIPAHVRNFYCSQDLEEQYRVALLPTPDDAAYRVQLFPAARTKVARIGVFVGTATEGSYDGGFRGYSVSYLVRILRGLEPFGEVVLFGASGERTEQERTALEKELAELPFVRNLCGKTSLEELISLISGCELVITNDSSPLHIAIGCGTKVVALFVNSLSARIGRSQGKVIGLNAFEPCFERTWRWRHNCSGCSARAYEFYGCNLKDFPHKQDLVPVEEVLHAVKFSIA